VLFQPLLA